MAVDEQALASSIDTLTQSFQALAGPPVQPMAAHLSAVVAAAVELLGADSVGILLLDEAGTLRAVASSTATAAALELAQQQLGIGPGHDATRRRGTVLVTDLAATPAYRPLLAELGQPAVRAVLSAPIWIDAEVVGNLNLIRTEAHSWTDSEVRAATAYAEVVGRLLGMGARFQKPALVMEQLFPADHADADAAAGERGPHDYQG
jgi:transcriptional regulator with GAF, ATPase, and Fis domain